jgi:CRP/FNR family transcriptional regulator, cyclic AMP receptor protein
MQLSEASNSALNPEILLRTTGASKRFVCLKENEILFSQGQPTDCLYYLLSGRAKVTVVSPQGREATMLLLRADEYVGEDSLANPSGLRVGTAIAITACTALKIEREEMLRVLHEEQQFADSFLRFIIERGMRTQADLVDHLFNSSEKRLARMLILMADLENPQNSDYRIPKISQEALAEMIGTSRSRVNLFMTRFRRLGFIEYDGSIRVRKSLLTVILGQ